MTTTGSVNDQTLVSTFIVKFIGLHVYIIPAFPKLCMVRGPLGFRETLTGGPREIIVEFRDKKMCKFLYTVTSKNLLLKSLLFLFINPSSRLKADYYAVILAIGSEENSVAFY